MRFSWTKFMRYVGPGWLVSVAYIGPSSLEARLQAGAYTNFDVLGVLMLSFGVGFFFQVLAARLGTVTGRSLSEHCSAEYPRPVALVLWLVAEAAIIGCDVHEILGSALALHVLTGIPLWSGCLVIGCATFAFLSLHVLGVRYVEAFFTVLLLAMGLCFVVDFGLVKVDWADAIGSVVPLITDVNARAAMNTLGPALVPHNLFLHSALVALRPLNRRDRSAVRAATLYASVEVGVALCTIFVVNVAVLGLFADAFYAAPCSVLPDQSACLPPATALYSGSPVYNYYSLAPCLVLNHTVSDDCPRCAMGHTQMYGYCQPLELVDAGSALRDTLGAPAAHAWAIALLAAGQASTMTATYAGQFVMEGFVPLRLPAWQRIAITRVLALLPAVMLAVSALDNKGAIHPTSLHVVQSLALPLALVPLVTLTSSRSVMGKGFINGARTRMAAIVLAGVLCILNLYDVGSAIAAVVWTSARSYATTGAMVVYVMVLLYITLLAPLCAWRASIVEAPEAILESLLDTNEDDDAA
ncbi:hypothetical protein SPRG_08275 [Saprolegnia parasitica CBS 223.65]|uniref:Uncharacterized protein n=1 Tax=Saprolegnia parasitica (strain CBS 223.65) TaxID=695850 RepID=A0A067CI28_SAPPC|nr:hypothetical protein SPRG_08275 [Saprolegnia parasitica CBS 223.65]KDO26472.1 hypothetical protein SPRG_08275 [Saprolegnia parasitica CBS 223.65]|eukprot:XP_012202907.1 hypothetical protein SPRG_08275 [Saprolegnia parasitica CBS 223.65]